MPLKITCMPRPAALAVALLCSMTLPAQAYDQLYVFGDSLSDTGNNGRFTYDGSQHLLYDEALAQRIGAALVASDNGGENYAAGGAVAVPGLNPVDNTQDQVQRYLNRVNGQADGDGLYIHWIGGNDLAAAALNAATAPGVAYNSAAAAAAQVHSLLNAGTCADQRALAAIFLGRGQHADAGAQCGTEARADAGFTDFGFAGVRVGGTGRQRERDAHCAGNNCNAFFHVLVLNGINSVRAGPTRGRKK